MYLMRGQTLFRVNWKMVSELLKDGHFLTNYLKLQISASYNNLRIRHSSEFDKLWPRAFLMSNVKIAHALTFDMPKKVFS